MSELGQVGLVKTTGFSSWLIRVWTNSDFNHTITRVSPHNVVSVQPDGVRIMPVTEFPNAVWSDFPLNVRQENKIIGFSLAQEHKKYGRLTFIWIGIALRTGWTTPAWLEAKIHDHHTWICSQLCDSAYQAAGIHLFRDDRTPSAVFPGSFVPIWVDAGWLPEGTH